jgi:hypothetical protein
MERRVDVKELSRVIGGLEQAVIDNTRRLDSVDNKLDGLAKQADLERALGRIDTLEKLVVWGGGAVAAIVAVFTTPLKKLFSML